MRAAALCFVVYCGLVLCSTTLVAQAPTDTSTTAHQRAYLAAARAMGFTNPARLKLYYRHRVDVTKADQLRRAGVDLRRLETYIQIDGQEDHQPAVLFADLIALVTVVSRQDDTRPDVYYHSSFRVKVDEVWQGRPSTDTLTVKQHSGATGTGSVMEFGERPLKVGKQMLLYLNPINVAELEQARAAGHWPYTPNYTASDFDALNVYTVAGGNVYLHENAVKDKLLRVRRRIQRLVRILDKEHFAQRSFARASR